MRKFLSLLFAMMLMVGSMSATTIYCKVDKSWWKADGAAVAVHHWGGTTAGTTWPGVRMTPVKGEADTWSYDVPADVTGLMFVRVNGSGDIADWGAKTANLTLPTDGKNLYTITSESAVWGDPGVAGEWSVYGEEPITPPAPAIPTVTVIGDMTNWESEIPFELAADSLSATLYNDNIKAGTYNFKMKIGGEWRSNGYTYHRGFTGAAGITGNAGNMTFTADIEGAYKFTWTFANDSLGFEYPELPVIIPAKFYVTGDSALVDSLAWQSNAIKSESDTLVLKLAAGSYTLKVTVDGTWKTAKGYSDLTIKADGLSTDKDNNIHFTLAEAGTVKVIYTNELFKLEGNFYAAPVAKFWVAGGEDIVGTGHGTWTKESALVSYKDTLTMNLAAGAHEFKLITENDEWWGIEHLTDTAEGVYTNEYTNVCFKLAEAGAVKVIYKAGEVFKVEGNFYVAPQAKYYVIGDSALVVNAGLTADKAWTPDAIVATNDTLVLNLAAGDYTMRLSLYGGWDNNKGFESLTEVTAGLREYVDEYQNHNIIFTLAEAGAVTIIYNANEFKILGNFYVAPVVVNYYAKYAAENGDWNWHALKEAEGKWLTDTIVYYGGGMNIHSAATDEGARYYAEIAGVAAKDTAYFTFNPADSTLAATVTGKYIAPVAPDPTVAVKGSMNAWGDSIPFVLAQDKLSASLTVENIKKGTYEFKMIINGEWRSNGYTYHRDFAGAAGITGNNDANMVLQLDADGQYTFTWTFANDSLGIIFPEKPASVLENGYYLVGYQLNAWTPAAQYLFAENTEAAGEYMLSVNLTEGDSIKVVYVENDAIKTWYPGGDNYVVDANHVGATTMYFRPDYQGGEGWYAGCIFIAPTGTVDVQNVATDTKAVKVLREGQVVIIRGEHIYTIMGQMIK